MTGTLRAMSGVTTAVTANAEYAGCAAAVAIGYCSGCCTVTRVASGPGTTFAGGGASCAGLPCAAPHPVTTSSHDREVKRNKIPKLLIFIILNSILPVWMLLDFLRHINTPDLPGRTTASPIRMHMPGTHFLPDF